MASQFDHKTYIPKKPRPPYKPLKITEGTSIQLKAESTKSIDVHLRELDQYVNIILPSGHIIVIEPDNMTMYDDTDTQIDTMKIVVK